MLLRNVSSLSLLRLGEEADFLVFHDLYAAEKRGRIRMPCEHCLSPSADSGQAPRVAQRPDLSCVLSKDSTSIAGNPPAYFPLAWAQASRAAQRKFIFLLAASESWLLTHTVNLLIRQVHARYLGLYQAC